MFKQIKMEYGVEGCRLVDSNMLRDCIYIIETNNPRETLTDLGIGCRLFLSYNAHLYAQSIGLKILTEVEM